MKRYIHNTWCFVREKKKNLVEILLIFFVIGVVAIVPMHKDRLVETGKADFGWCEFNTHVSLCFLNNWLKDGAINNKFLLNNLYPSVEISKKEIDKRIYISYPPGYLLPLYVIEKVRGAKEASVYTIKYFLIFEFYLSILFLSLIFYTFLDFIRLKSRLLKISVPIILSCVWAYLPLNFLFMRNEFFTDQAIIFVSVIFILIEFLSYTVSRKTIRILLNIMSCLLVFYGILTDYYFLFILFFAVIFRIIHAFEEYPNKTIIYKLFSTTWAWVLSAFTAVLLFFLQLYASPNTRDQLLGKFLQRTSFSGDNGEFMSTLYDRFCQGFSCFFVPVLVLTFFVCVFFLFKVVADKKIRMLVRFLSILVFSCVMHTVTFLNHVLTHNWSLLKYNLVFVFILFTFFCWVYIKYQDKFENLGKKCSSTGFIFATAILIIFFTWIKSIAADFYKTSIRHEEHKFALFIKNNTDFYDVIYSPDYNEAPPHMYLKNEMPQDMYLYYEISRKMIYQISSFDEIPATDLPDKAVINILISDETLNDDHWRELKNENYCPQRVNNYYLFKFSKKDYQSLFYRYQKNNNL